MCARGRPWRIAAIRVLPPPLQRRWELVADVDRLAAMCEAAVSKADAARIAAEVGATPEAVTAWGAADGSSLRFLAMAMLSKLDDRRAAEKMVEEQAALVRCDRDAVMGSFPVEMHEQVSSHIHNIEAIGARGSALGPLKQLYRWQKELEGLILRG